MEMFLDNKTVKIMDAHGMKLLISGMNVQIILMETSLQPLCAVTVVEAISLMMISLYTISITLHSQVALNHMTSKSNILPIVPQRILELQSQTFSL